LCACGSAEENSNFQGFHAADFTLPDAILLWRSWRLCERSLMRPTRCRPPSPKTISRQAAKPQKSLLRALIYLMTRVGRLFVVVDHQGQPASRFRNSVQEPLLRECLKCVVFRPDAILPWRAWRLCERSLRRPPAVDLFRAKGLAPSRKDHLPPSGAN